MDTERFSQAYFGDVKVSGLNKEILDKTLTRFKKKTLLAFLLSLPQGARVLDVGCGKGKAFAIAKAYRPDLVLVGIDGADLASWMPAGVEYVRGDVERLEDYFPPESFDAVLCQHVVEHLVYPGTCVVGMRNVLRVGGTLYLETPNWTRLLVPFSHLYFYNDYTHVRPYTRYTLHRLLYESGFSSVESASWSSVPLVSPKSVASQEGVVVEVASATKYHRSLLAKVLSRLVTPLVRDVLVVVASRKE